MNPVALFSFRSVSAIGSKGMRTPPQTHVSRLLIHWIRTMCRTSGCCWCDACFLFPVPVFRGLCFPARHPPFIQRVCVTHAAYHLTERWLLRQTGWIYFHFLFLYSGLEFTLCFLTHLHFNYSRSVFILTLQTATLTFGHSMQQGKMFLFMGTVMALTQGGLVRRITPGRELLFALLVRPPVN